MSQDKDHKARMASHPDAPPGLETDGKGNIIPFEERTPEDQAKAQARIARDLHAGDQKPVVAPDSAKSGETEE